MSEKSKKIVIIGGGPAGLIAAQYLSQKPGLDVHLYDQKSSVGRKFLIAGRGGLNLTHSEESETFSGRYGPAAPFMSPYLTEFTPADLQSWANDLGIETFIGSSGRIFPKEMKASNLMRAWTKRLTAQGVTFHLRHKFTGVTETSLLQFVDKDDNQSDVAADAVLFAMGGASYPHLGATGDWQPVLTGLGMDIADFKPVNCGYNVTWSAFMLEKFEGDPIKNVCLTFNNETSRGDLILSKYGLEGGAIYALSRSLTNALTGTSQIILKMDLRPDFTQEALTEKLSAPRKKQSLTSFLRKRLNFSSLEAALLREFPGNTSLQSPQSLAAHIKALEIPLTGTRPLESAISTAGGLKKDLFGSSLMLEKHPGWFAAGEMIDWDAPTGGYLLQGCFSTGVAAAKGIERWLNVNNAP